MIGRDYSEEGLTADAQAVNDGPSGASSLRLSPRAGTVRPTGGSEMVWEERVGKGGERAREDNI